jgi:hypothetical protein
MIRMLFTVRSCEDPSNDEGFCILPLRLIARTLTHSSSEIISSLPNTAALFERGYFRSSKCVSAFQSQVSWSPFGDRAPKLC